MDYLEYSEICAQLQSAFSPAHNAMGCGHVIDFQLRMVERWAEEAFEKGRGEEVRGWAKRGQEERREQHELLRWQYLDREASAVWRQAFHRLADIARDCNVDELDVRHAFERAYATIVEAKARP